MVLLPIASFLQPLETTSLLSVDLILEISCKWNQMICAVLCWLLSFGIMFGGLTRVVTGRSAPFLLMAE